jgi:hypothetical protein
MATTTDPKTELPGMPTRPELRAKGGRLVEHATVSVRGSESFDLNSQAAIDYIEGFTPDQVVELVVHGRVGEGGGDRSKVTKDGTTLVRHLVFVIDHIDGVPNDEAQTALAEADGE